MHSKSRNKILEELAGLTEKEIFIGYLTAMKRSDFDLGLSILRKISVKDRVEIEKYFSFYFIKQLTLQSLLLNKAILSVLFYNIFASKAVGLMDKNEQLTPHFIKNMEKQQQTWKKMILELDDECGDILQLDEFKNLEQLENLFDSWRDIYRKDELAA